MIEQGMDDYFKDLAGRLLRASHGKRSDMIEQTAQTFGISRAKVYRKLREAGWRSGRKLREDRGDTRLSEPEAKTISALMTESARANGKRLLGVSDAMAIARASGKLHADVSPATAMRIMRLRGLHPDQIARPTPHTPLASLHPNHVWQFDASLCVLFYLDHGGVGVMDQKTFYKNKPGNLARVSDKRVWRYLVTDHYSGAFYMEYFQTAGENQETLFNFLMSAFFKRAHGQDPFHGVPFRLVWDAGSANQSYLIRNLLDRLGVAHHAHIPGNPRAKGQVEVTHNVIERKFEGRLPFVKVRDVAHLNDMGHIWMREFNANFTHSRHHNSRYGLWQTIRQDQLRLPASRQICEQLLHTKPERRTVRGNLTISYKIKGGDARDYSVAHVPHIRVGETVEVCVNPYRAPNVDVIVCDQSGSNAIYECPPVQKDAAGFTVGAPVIGERFQAAPDTEVDANRKRLLKEAYGVESLRDAEAKRKNRDTAFGGDVDPITYLEHQTNAHYMRRPGTDLDLPERANVQIKPLTVTQACKRLLALLEDRWDPAMRDKVRAWYPDGVPEEELQRLAARLSAPPAQDNLIALKR